MRRPSSVQVRAGLLPLLVGIASCDSVLSCQGSTTPAVGDTCSEDEDCWSKDYGHASDICIQDWPGGYCVVSGTCEGRSSYTMSTMMAVVTPAGVVIRALARCSSGDDCRRRYECKDTQLGYSACMPPDVAPYDFPYMSDCRAECEAYYNCRAEAYRDIRGEIPDSYLPENVAKTCVAECRRCPDASLVAEAAAQADALKACAADNPPPPTCASIAWCRYASGIGETSLVVDNAAVDFDAQCLGVEVTPEFVWQVERTSVLGQPYGWVGCVMSDCTTWLECSGYNAVKAHDAAVGGTP